MIGDIIIGNVLASGCIVLLIYIFDINEKEPPWTLVRLFLISIIATFLFGKLKAFLFDYYKWQFDPIFSFFVVAGFFEELLKFILVLIFVWPLKSFNDKTDGIVYYLVIAAGFSVLENVGYSFQFVINPFIFGLKTGNMNFYHEALRKIVLFRAVSGHFFINLISGFFLGYARMNKKYWMLIPGFILTVILHGLWNFTASLGYINYYIIFLILVDVILFYIITRSSFYYKFMKRLKKRIKSLIDAARIKSIDINVITLMEGILANIGFLRQMEGPELTKNAKYITLTLPAKIDEIPIRGKGGLIEILLKINTILAKEKKKAGIGFWIKLFLMLVISGFLILILLMNFM
ncbi:MAG: PrsW family glutamic-type intramembrane protease [bacterium]